MKLDGSSQTPPKQVCALSMDYLHLNAEHGGHNLNHGGARIWPVIADPVISLKCRLLALVEAKWL